MDFWWTSRDYIVSVPNIFVKKEDPEKDMLRWQEETRDGKLDKKGIL
jgi:hypothetical protein